LGKSIVRSTIKDIAHAEGVASRHLHHERSVLKNRTGAIGDAAVTASDVLRRKRKQFSPDGVNNLEMSVRPMRYRACNQAHNAEVEIWVIFATRNSLKLHMMQKLFSTISNVRAITQKLCWQMTAAASVKPR
jgi:hypothetical protein